MILNIEFTIVSAAATVDHKSLDLVFQDVLSTCTWWHMDQFGTTTEHDTEHYYLTVIGHQNVNTPGNKLA